MHRLHTFTSFLYSNTTNSHKTTNKLVSKAVGNPKMANNNSFILKWQNVNSELRRKKM